jgi:site-specific recombinase XerD
MNQKEKVSEITSRILDDLKRQNYSAYTIGQYRQCYNGLRRYMEGLEAAYYSSEIGLSYIRQKFGIEIEGLYGKQPENVRSTIRALQVLWDYSEYGSMVVKVRPGTKAFECPVCFSAEYEAFLTECEVRRYTRAGMQTRISIIRRLLVFLADAEVSKSDEINAPLMLKFLTSYSGCCTRYLATIVSVLKGFFRFLLLKGFLSLDLTLCLPKIKIARGGFLPSSWRQDDVRKMLASVDRNNPGGKRDYAILLMVTRLGLRAGDIRALKLSSLNWTRKEISITMQKTKQPLILPLLDDVGWAVIDYLKNGRPETASDCVFIKHRAPYDGFSDFNSMDHMINRNMNKAGIKIPGKHGMHSLRSTLARIMLETGAPLPVISEALGHQNMQTTGIYLNIDVEGLKRCAIDPEEVSHEQA